MRASSIDKIFKRKHGEELTKIYKLTKFNLIENK